MYRFERSAARTPFAALSHRFQARHARSTGPLAQHTSITVTTVGTAQRLSIVPHKDTQTLLRKDTGSPHIWHGSVLIAADHPFHCCHLTNTHSKKWLTTTTRSLHCWHVHAGLQADTQEPAHNHYPSVSLLAQQISCFARTRSSYSQPLPTLFTVETFMTVTILA